MRVGTWGTRLDSPSGCGLGLLSPPLHGEGRSRAKGGQANGTRVDADLRGHLEWGLGS